MWLFSSLECLFTEAPTPVFIVHLMADCVRHLIMKKQSFTSSQKSFFSVRPASTPPLQSPPPASHASLDLLISQWIFARVSTCRAMTKMEGILFKSETDRFPAAPCFLQREGEMIDGAVPLPSHLLLGSGPWCAV